MTASRDHAPRERAKRSRPLSVLLLFLIAIVGGGLAGVIGAAFIWLIDTLYRLVWSDLPKAIGVDAYHSWWLFAIPIVGGLLVGLGQLFLGNHPDSIEHNLALWRSGGRVPPRTLPATTFNSLSSLVAGAPVGFEAALTGLLGGVATLIAERLGAARHLVREAWGSERVDRLPRAARSVPTWLAAISGLVVYRWLPFGQIDFGFRFGPSDAKLSIVNGLLIFLIGAVVAVPIAWALSVVRRAEVATVFRKSPIVIAIAGGVAFALLAVGNPFVLSTGQQGIQHLESLGIGTLLFLTVAKWAGLVIALFTGWRGGPIFPLFFAVAALAGVLSHLFSMPSDLAMIAGIAAVSVVFVRGKLVIGFILTLYAVPIPYTLEILIAGIAASAALSIAGAFGALPAAQADAAAAATPPAAS